MSVRNRGVGALLAASLIVGITASPAQSQLDEGRQDEIADEISIIAAQFDESVAAEAELLAALEISRVKKAELDAKVARLSDQTRTIRAGIALAESRIAAAALEVEASRTRLAVAESALNEARGDFEAQVFDLYTGTNLGESIEMLTTLTESDDVSDLQLTVGYSHSVVNWRQDAVTQRTELVTDIEQILGELAQAQDSAKAEERRLSDQERRLAAALADEKSTQTAVANEVATQRALVVDVQAQQTAYEQRVDELENESAAIEAELRRRAEEQAARRAAEEEARRKAEEQARIRAAEEAAAAEQARLLAEEEARRNDDAPDGTSTASTTSTTSTTTTTTTPPRTGDGRPGLPLQFPIPGARITSQYGPRTHPVYGTTRNHTGIDLGASSGTRILSAAAGEVVTAGRLGGYGNTVVIDHGGGIATLYAHQSSVSVVVGEIVTRGEVIGRVGSTGVSTGPHLHFEVREKRFAN